MKRAKVLPALDESPLDEQVHWKNNQILETFCNFIFLSVYK